MFDGLEMREIDPNINLRAGDVLLYQNSFGDAYNNLQSGIVKKTAKREDGLDEFVTVAVVEAGRPQTRVINSCLVVNAWRPS